MKLDILVLASHPDDAELCCGGTIAAAIAQGKKVGIVDLTRGELGTRGTPATRAQEAADAARLLGIAARENLGLPDGFFRNDREHQLPIVAAVRRYQPDIVFCNAVHDRHPDHGRGSALASDACFLAGLKMIETLGDDGQPQAAWRPRQVYHFIQDRYIKPDFVVDISAFWQQKRAAVAAYASQFNVAADGQPHTHISSPEFWHFMEGRAREFGHAVGVEFGEGFTVERPIGVRDVATLF
ncbi:bacillithiol biosynthesis deacetylase BshB1 [Hymenobacter lutimineralis]|uniref:Bacillithiol biosynthesis deacetylase BshB1 n=1 Tax=Hymenobacter lutimineralis TaxID=2606448 RepID=A0A5D6UVF8_9BACT|nr:MULTISPECIES: bacillithiol biosynthesis deacetylase BshB1 [Hymenobacter]QIX59730.1 bacillithiol biosynthesis deacetylase BshB1 [Hymenobacter sp. BT18]TYZ06379.1 bacillithiol biosynthesis deacetylase BshB1 [Hymenobacter lutimineralis]